MIPKRGCWTCAQENLSHLFRCSYTTVTDSRQYSNDLPQGGLEVPCVPVFKFCGEAKTSYSIGNRDYTPFIANPAMTIDKVRRLLPANNKLDSDKPLGKHGVTVVATRWRFLLGFLIV